MAHRIGDIRDTSVAECYQRIRLCHDYLAAAGKQAVHEMNAIGELPTWGTDVKRIAVPFDGIKPTDIGGDLVSHNLVEVVNQTATVERLLDVLEWVQTPESGLAQFEHVVVCHPTTSCAPQGKDWENDLVLCNADLATARFEISDVGTASDGNNKYRRDLISLRVNAPESVSGGARLFLAVSEEFANHVRKRRPISQEKAVSLAEVKAKGKTRVFEILRSLATTS